MSGVRALVLAGFGINCEEETAAAFRLAGASATVIHLNSVLSGEWRLSDFQVVALPGGFSFGDDLGAGKALANRLRYRRVGGGERMLDALRGFLARGGYVLGICNGFQALVKMGLLPDVGGEQRQEVTLARNDCGHFVDRWVYCRVKRPGATPFLEGMGVVALPVRHGEGKVVVREGVVADRIVEQGLDCLGYCDEGGEGACGFPANPNGSWRDCAGLTDRSGQVFGLMPHPEAFLSLYNHPDWPCLVRECPEMGEEGGGLRLFRNIVRHLGG